MNICSLIESSNFIWLATKSASSTYLPTTSLFKSFFHDMSSKSMNVEEGSKKNNIILGFITLAIRVFVLRVHIVAIIGILTESKAKAEDGYS